MTLRVVGSGMGRTGTMSLKLALARLLGGPCYHMVEVFARPADFAIWTAAGRGQPVDWRALFEGFVAAVDWPVAAFWPEIAATFPEALILHSTRDPESWWKSASETIFGGGSGDPPGGPAMKEMLEAVLGSRFTPHIHDKAAAVAAFERNNAQVLATAPKERLVVWSARDGWGPLCKALGVPVPDEPFPRANTTEEFQARIAARTAGAPGAH